MKSRDRCAAYRLAGGVAEYGAVIYNRETGAVRPLLYLLAPKRVA
jgi:hypothetical protein